MIGSRSLASVALGALLLTASASIASAQGNDKDKGENQQVQNDDDDRGGNVPNGNAYGHLKNHPVDLAATPELDSLVLFGTGLAGVAGYGALRWRMRRR
ncbi:MAG: hypothetical protein JO020_19370 [Chloroflexi bacterium]|nr:hypothetical protein [Chloroflexota bacterium]